MSRKIIPPVSPKIVRENPRQQLFRRALLIFAFLLTAWFAFDYGRSERPVNADAAVVLQDDSAQRVGQLEQERDALKQQVSELQQNMEQANQALGTSQARIQALQQALSSTNARQEVVVTPVVPAVTPEPATDIPATVNDALLLENLDIEPTESADTFRLRFTVRQAANSNERVTGNIWIAVNGVANGKPKRLSLKVLSSQRSPYVKMGFDQQQDVIEDLVLPEDFLPKNILIEVKPYGETYTGTSEKFTWDTDG